MLCSPLTERAFLLSLLFCPCCLFHRTQESALILGVKRATKKVAEIRSTVEGIIQMLKMRRFESDEEEEEEEEDGR